MGMKPPLRDHNTSFSVKGNTVFMHYSTDSLPLSAILCKLAHKQEQHDTSALGKGKN
jgi:hypothetical protein